jgi:tetraacyldisaccharide 4'-kinase
MFISKAKLKIWYVDLLEKDKKSFFEYIFYSFLCILSLFYKVAILFRNFLYDSELLSSSICPKKVISVGGFSWGGSGKTTLSMWLCEKLSPRFKIAVLRRGYGEDEDKLLEEKGIEIYSSVDRAGLANELAGYFDVFILDDGYQYRRLKKDVNIAIVGPEDFKRGNRLIPASPLREPLSSLVRADMVVFSYKKREDNQRREKLIRDKFPHKNVYYSYYQFKRFITLDTEEKSLDYFKDKRIAALTAIGYPSGFFDILEGLRLDIACKIKYPDHYILSEREFHDLKEKLLKKGVEDLVITYKDKYHLPKVAFQSDLNIFIMEIYMKIEKEKEFLKEIEAKLCN